MDLEKPFTFDVDNAFTISEVNMCFCRTQEEKEWRLYQLMHTSILVNISVTFMVRKSKNATGADNVRTSIAI